MASVKSDVKDSTSKPTLSLADIKTSLEAFNSSVKDIKLEIVEAVTPVVEEALTIDISSTVRFIIGSYPTSVVLKNSCLSPSDRDTLNICLPALVIIGRITRLV